MANLTETSTYDAGVYQIETSDPVTGGAAGVANKGAVNLANRTKYLKTHVDALELAKDASGGYSGLTTFKLNLKNTGGTILSWLTNAATAARTWTMPDKDGTVAMTSDITGGGQAGSFTTLSATGDVTLSKQNAFLKLTSPIANTTFSGYSIGAGTDILTSWYLNATTGQVNLSAGYTGWGGFFTLTTNGVERMRLDSSGNLGVGAVPGGLARVQVNGALSAGRLGIPAFIQDNGGTDYGNDLYLPVDGGTSTQKSFRLRTSYNGGNPQLRFDVSSNSAAQFTNPSALTFFTGMTMDASGNLALGVVPSAWGSTWKALQVGAGVALTGESVSVARLSANSDINSSGVDSYRASASASQYLQNAGTHTWFTAPSGTAGASISFTQAMTLDASGTLLLGTTSAAGGNSNSLFFVASTGAFSVQHASGTASGSTYTNYNYNGVTIGSITQNGTTTTSFNTTSDHRLKENVRPSNAARFMDIEFVDFEWVDGRHDCGVIAGQLQSVYPDLVIGEVDATEVRQVEITPAVPAVTEQRQLTPAVPTVYDGEQIVSVGMDATYETVEITPAIPAVVEDQEFPVYQQVNYTGLIGRMGTRVQQLQRTVDAQAAMLTAMEARLAALECR